MSETNTNSCPDVPAFPDWAESSSRYRDLFNQVATEQGVPIRYVRDTEGGLANVPEPDRGEIEVNPNQSSFQVTPEVLCRIRGIIEGRRRQFSEITSEQMRVIPSATTGDDRMNIANPAEQEWLRRTSGPSQEASLDIFGRQANYRYFQMERWMEEGHGDHYSRHHFLRMRDIKPPSLNSSLRPQHGNLIPFGNLFPWFPEAPAFNAMLPNLSDAEKDYLVQKYTENDPIRLPWTVVQRASDTEIAAVRNRREVQAGGDAITVATRRHRGEAVAWLVKGYQGNWYRVTNISHHPDFRPSFLQMARVLRQNAFITIRRDGHRYTLDPQFRQYTITMAECLERGSYQRLLEADLNQTEGNLFFTFFPHEGYWRDGIKFPFMLDIGIRAPSAMGAEEAAIFQDLEDVSAQIARESNLPYTRRVLDLREIEKSAVLFWPYRTGGFMRAYHREPAGHDYPKRTYPGISLHRTVALLDSLVAGLEPARETIRQLIDPNATIEMEDMVDDVTWHEGTHGTGARPDSPTDSGRTMSQVYGNFWGAIAEPLADAGAVVALDLRHQRGLINDAEFRRGIHTFLAFQFRRYLPKQDASSLENMGDPDSAHLVGSSMAVGWLAHEGVIRLDGRRIQVNYDQVIPAIRRFHTLLTRFSLQDALPRFQQAVQELVRSIPNPLEARLVEFNANVRPSLIDRSPDGIR